MKKLEIGKPGDAWKKEYEVLLLNAIRSLYGGHLPYTYSVGEVVDEMNLHYQTDRSDNAMYEEIKSILNKEGGVFRNIEMSKDKQYVLAQEYSDAKLLDKRFFADKITEEGRLVCETSVSKKGKRILYIFPSVLDADYGEIFTSVFRVNRTAKKEFKKDVEKFYKINEEKWISIPAHHLSGKQYDKLHTAVWFLLDLLLSVLTADLNNSKRNKGNKRQQEERKDKREIITKILAYFESYGYVFSHKQKLVKLLNTRSIPLEGVDVSILSKMMNESSNSTFKIPEYSIFMSKLFELYAYSHFSLVNPQIVVEYKPHYDKKKPDMFFSDDELNACVIDAKYKFQYGRNDKYCEIDDANRMYNYLLYLEQDKPGCQAKGLFCYPTLKREKRVYLSDLLNNKRIAKVSITLPVKY